jgi:hypothetical protein
MLGQTNLAPDVTSCAWERCVDGNKNFLKLKADAVIGYKGFYVPAPGLKPKDGNLYYDTYCHFIDSLGKESTITNKSAALVNLQSNGDIYRAWDGITRI